MSRFTASIERQNSENENDFISFHVPFHLNSEWFCCIQCCTVALNRGCNNKDLKIEKQQRLQMAQVQLNCVNISNCLMFIHEHDASRQIERESEKYFRKRLLKLLFIITRRFGERTKQAAPSIKRRNHQCCDIRMSGSGGAIEWD